MNNYIANLKALVVIALTICRSHSSHETHQQIQPQESKANLAKRGKKLRANNFKYLHADKYWITVLKTRGLMTRLHQINRPVSPYNALFTYLICPISYSSIYSPHPMRRKSHHFLARVLNTTINIKYNMIPSHSIQQNTAVKR